MVKHLIILPDGTELFSGPETVNAIQRVTLTQQVNTGTELTMGAVCAAKLEAELLTPAGGLRIPVDTELILCTVNDAGVREQAGIFTVAEAIRPSANRYRLTAYDRVSGLDKDLTGWLDSLAGWPYTLHDFAKMVCNACHLTLITDSIPNGDWLVQRFSAKKVTGRQLMQWVGEASGRFCCANPDGQLLLEWYAPGTVSVTPDCMLDTLFSADYRVAPVDKVQIRRDTQDLGTVCGSGSNGYVITGNPLLMANSQSLQQAAAEVLYEILNQVSYTPCTVTVPADAGIRVGEILQVTDKNGRTFPVYVMKKVRQGQKDRLECTGSPRRNSVRAANSYGITDLQGKYLELELGVDGLRAENKDSTGKLSSLQLTVDGLRTKVSSQQTGIDSVASRVSTVEQSAEGLSLRVKSVIDDGVSKVSTSAGYTFDENGITVTKSGREIKTQITEDGMTVYKNGNAVLTANSQGVDAVDLHASTYLIIAGKSRFEKYKGTRVGCFWIGG